MTKDDTLREEATATAGSALPPAESRPEEAPSSETSAGTEKEASAKPAEIRRARGRQKTVSVGIAHIQATFNNTIVTITDPKGNVVSWSSAGRVGLKGSRKSTSFAATLVGQDAGRQAVARGLYEVEVRVQGAGAGRESAIRALRSVGLNIALIRDVTPIPHDGCRPRKRRRV